MIRRHWRVIVGLLSFFVLASVGLAVAAPGDPLSIASFGPADGSVYTAGGHPTITAVVQDGVLPVTAELVVDGTEYTPTVDGTGYTFSYTPEANLADGSHSVAFTATDSEGTVVSQAWSFEVDVTPSVVYRYPTPGTAWAAGQGVWFFVTVADNAPPVSATLSIDGVVISSTPGAYDPASSSFQFQIYRSLTQGVHTIAVDVVDEGGNELHDSWVLYGGGEVTLGETGIANGQLITSSQQTWVFRANSLYTRPSFYLTIDGASNTYSYNSAWSDGDHTLTSTVWPWILLADGPHRVVAQVTASPGLSLSRTYDIEYRVPPTVTHLRPARDIASTTTTPTLSVRATDNSTVAPTFAFTLDGVPLSGATARSISSNRWEGTVALTEPLEANATHSASVTVTDSAGNTTTRSWDFFVARGSQMSHYDSGDCGTCHGNPYYVHSQNIVWDEQYSCNGCHTYWHYRNAPANLENPTSYSTCFPSCHKVGDPGVVVPAHPYYYNNENCRLCHERVNVYNAVGEPANGRGESLPLMSEVPRHAVGGDHSACGECHTLDLTYAHADRTDAAGAAFTCSTCHQSTDPTVLSAIEAKDGSCESCHGSVDHVTPHDAAAVNRSCVRFCHSTDVAEQHGDDCATCHDSTVVRVRGAIDAGDPSCPACHDAPRSSRAPR